MGDDALIKKSFEQTLFTAESSNVNNRIQSMLEFRLYQDKQTCTPNLVKTVKSMNRDELKDFLKNPDNNMKFRFMKKVKEEDWGKLHNIIPSDGWCGYRVTAHLIVTLSTLNKNENAYEAVVNKLNDCSLHRKYLCNITGKKSKSNNNKFHTFWFEIIDVLKKMVNDKSKLMLKKALKMEVKTFSFLNEREILEYWSNELDVFLTKVVNIFLLY